MFRFCRIKAREEKKKRAIERAKEKALELATDAV